MAIKKLFFIVMHFVNVISVGFCGDNLSISNVNEVDNRFLLIDNKNVIYSQNRNGFYNLLKYSINTNKISLQTLKKSDIFSPFIFNKTIAALTDYKGNQEFKCINIKHNFFKVNRFIWLYSSSNGNIIIYQLQNDSKIRIYNVKESRHIIVDNIQFKMKGISFDKACARVVISFDGKMILYNIKENNKIILCESINGDKENPFFYNNKIYFVSNAFSEYNQIYEINAEGKKNPRLVLKEKNEVKLPKVIDNFLYYIKIVRSQYLLVKKDLKTNKIFLLTTKGVVFNYEVTNKHTVIAVYSDENTPKSIIKINIKANTCTVKNISNHKRQLSCIYSFLKVPNLSPAYLLTNKSKKPRGVIIFFHPGINLDFSPRWETTLINFCEAGYMILAPNYPKSYGYGKTYYNSDYKSSVEDIVNWTNYTCVKYKGIPVYYLNYSSSNELMENVITVKMNSIIANNQNNISCAISYFGIPANRVRFNKIPTLYFLGENDPYIDVRTRSREIETQMKVNNYFNEVFIFNDEGHWIRREENMLKAVKKSLIFLRMNSQL